MTSGPSGAEDWVRTHAPAAGPLTLHQEEPWATVYRAAIPDGSVWLKVCAQRQAFEVPLTVDLSSRWASAPEVLAHDIDRRWLLMADAGTSFRELGNPPQRWLDLLPAYAELQRDETARAGAFLALGVPDLRLASLTALYEDLLAADLPIDRAERSALAEYQAPFARMCAELAAAGIADTVQHDDLHMNNVYVRNGAVRILDWGDASIGHPFFSLFETFRFLVAFTGLSPDDAWFARLRDAYLEPWGGDRRETFELALRIGAMSRAIAWLHQREALPATERVAFDDGFDHILRLALAGSHHLS